MPLPSPATLRATQQLQALAEVFREPPFTALPQQLQVIAKMNVVGLLTFIEAAQDAPAPMSLFRALGFDTPAEPEAVRAA